MAICRLKENQKIKWKTDDNFLIFEQCPIQVFRPSEIRERHLQTKHKSRKIEANVIVDANVVRWSLHNISLKSSRELWFEWYILTIPEWKKGVAV